MTAVFDEHEFGYWRCDNCGRTLSAVATSPSVRRVLPPPWREREVFGYVGTFHVCSDACQDELPVTLRARTSGAD